ncbi:SRPBCC family protein, partial [Streptomyces sp. NPDC055078]
MDHEVFVPVPAETVRQVLRDPARVARCLHGFQRSADADDAAGPGGQLSGRLKVRIGNHSITYRGTLRTVEQGDVFTAEGDGTESRGTGSVRVTLTVRPVDADGGTTLNVTASATADPAGRLAELPPHSVEQAARRLLDRFAERLATVAAEPPGPTGAAGAAGAVGSEGPGPVSSADAERLGLVGDEPPGTPEPG